MIDETMNQPSQPDVAQTSGRRRLLATKAYLGRFGVGEVAGVRCMPLGSRQAKVPSRPAKGGEVMRSGWITPKWLRMQHSATRRTREGLHQGAASASPTRTRRDEAAVPAICPQIVVVGDSLGAGRGDSVAGLELVGWADWLAVDLRSRQTGVCITNLARSGLTTAEIFHTQLDHARALQPQLIVLIAGGNDLIGRTWDPDAFRRDYMALLGSLLASGATVLTTTWHNVTLAVPMSPALARLLSQRLDQASAIVRGVSDELGAPCIDFWHMPDLLDAACCSTDGIHPNARGYHRVAGVVADALGRHTGVSVPHSVLRSLSEHRLDHSARSSAGPAADLGDTAPIYSAPCTLPTA